MADSTQSLARVVFEKAVEYLAKARTAFMILKIHPILGHAD
ncbi:MAG: hypothetical protein ACLQPD_19080 [Desulfomonilaceae bacterium]